MNSKLLIIIVLVAAALIGAAALVAQKHTPKPKSGGNSSGLIVSANSIYVTDQAPSRTVAVAVARLKKPGFVAIHEDTNGKPGKILGVSGFLPPGETKGLPPISLSRVTKDGETLYAMLHFDDGSGTFDETKDAPALDSTGGEPVMMIFTVSADASPPAAVNP